MIHKFQSHFFQFKSTEEIQSTLSISSSADFTLFQCHWIMPRNSWNNNKRYDSNIFEKTEVDVVQPFIDPNQDLGSLYLPDLGYEIGCVIVILPNRCFNLSILDTRIGSSRKSVLHFIDAENYLLNCLR